MRVEFSLEFGTPMSPADLATLQGLVEGADELKLSDDGKVTNGYLRALTGDLDVVLAALPTLTRNIRLTRAAVPYTAWSAVISEVRKLADRIAAGPAPRSTGDGHFNDRVHVHVPGLGLMAVQQVEVRPDHCTEALQKDLDAGWRILAVCPQPDQRRPDYILGRTDKGDG